MGIFNDIDNVAGSSAVNLAGGLAGTIASARQANKQRNFVKWQMRNRYQLQVQDMLDAGLNPALSYGSAAPGPVPGAAQNLQNPASGAAAASMTTAQRNLVRRQAEQTEAKTNETLANESRLDNEAQVSAAQIKKVQEETTLIRENAKIMREERKARAAQGAKGAELENIYEGEFGKTLIWLNEISKSLQGAASAGSSAAGAAESITETRDRVRARARINRRRQNAR